MGVRMFSWRPAPRPHVEIVPAPRTYSWTYPTPNIRVVPAPRGFYPNVGTSSLRNQILNSPAFPWPWATR